MSDDNREAVVRVVLEAWAPSVSPECICGHPQLAHEDDVGFCWDCDACAADPACREFVERFAGERSDGDSHWATVVIDDAFEPRELTEAELERSNRVSDALATNRPEMDWIAATEIQRLAEEDPLAYPRGTAPAMAHLIERDRQRFGYGSKERS